MSGALLDAYFKCRTWYEKAQPTDCTQDSMYNQARESVKAFLDAFMLLVGGMVPYPPATTYPFIPWVPGTTTFPPGGPIGPDITWGAYPSTCGTPRNR